MRHSTILAITVVVSVLDQRRGFCGRFCFSPAFILVGVVVVRLFAVVVVLSSRTELDDDVDDVDDVTSFSALDVVEIKAVVVVLVVVVVTVVLFFVVIFAGRRDAALFCLKVSACRINTFFPFFCRNTTRKKSSS